MATVSYGYIITQSDALPVPTKATLGASGLVAIDASGVLAPEFIDLGDGIYAIAPAGKTADQFAQAFHSYALGRGYGHQGAGGGQILTYDGAVLPTFAALPAGAWTPT